MIPFVVPGLGGGSGTITGSGTATHLSIWTGTTSLGNSAATDDGTNLLYGGGAIGFSSASVGSTVQLNTNAAIRQSLQINASGAAVIDAGNGTTGVNGGNIVLNAGTATNATGGLIQLDAGSSSTGPGGDVYLHAGGASAGGQPAGNILLGAGQGAAIAGNGTIQIGVGTGSTANPFYEGTTVFANLGSLAQSTYSFNTVNAAIWCSDCLGAADGAVQGSVAVGSGTGADVINDGSNWRVRSGIGGGGGGGGSVTSVTGTLHQIDVANPTSTPSLSISSTFAFPGTATGATPSAGNSSTNLATTAFVHVPQNISGWAATTSSLSNPSPLGGDSACPGSTNTFSWVMDGSGNYEPSASIDTTTAWAGYSTKGWTAFCRPVEIVSGARLPNFGANGALVVFKTPNATASAADTIAMQVQDNIATGDAGAYTGQIFRNLRRNRLAGHREQAPVALSEAKYRRVVYGESFPTCEAPEPSPWIAHSACRGLSFRMPSPGQAEAMEHSLAGVASRLRLRVTAGPAIHS